MNAHSLPDILMCWDDLYQMQHRGGDVGKIVIEKISETHYRSIQTTVYPDDLSYGVGHGFAKRWLPRGTHFTVEYDLNEPAMDRGGEQTIIHFKWEENS